MKLLNVHSFNCFTQKAHIIIVTVYSIKITYSFGPTARLKFNAQCSEDESNGIRTISGLMGKNDIAFCLLQRFLEHREICWELCSKSIVVVELENQVKRHIVRDIYSVFFPLLQLTSSAIIRVGPPIPNQLAAAIGQSDRIFCFLIGSLRQRQLKIS